MFYTKNMGTTKKSFEICLKKFRNATEDIVKEVVLRQFFEKSSAERERIRRRAKKEKKKLKLFKAKYGYKYINYLEML